MERGIAAPTSRGDEVSGDPYACLRDPAFLRLWKEANGRVLTRDEFCRMPMPQGVSADQAWEAVGLLRRYAGICLGPNERLASSVWMNLPREERRLARDIAARGSAESALGALALLGTRRRSSFIEEQVREVEAALGTDGETLGYEDVRAVLLDELPPSSTAELLALNYSEVYERELARERGDPPAMKQGLSMGSLYERLVSGIKPEVVPRWNRPVADNVSRFLASMDRLDSYDIPAASSYIWGAAARLGIVQPYGALFGSLVRKVFLIRGHMPALALLPLTTVAREAELADDDTDTTRPTSKYLHLMGRQLDHLEGLVGREEGRRQDLRAMLGSSGAVNLRQREVLLKMLEESDAEYDYSSYAERFQVAYNTARSDLTGLARLGLMASGEHQNRRVFRAAPNYLSALGAWLARTAPGAGRPPWAAR